MEWYKHKKLTDQEVRRMALPKGLSRPIEKEEVAHLGITPLVDTPQPSHTSIQRVINKGVLEGDTVSTQIWEVVDKFGTKEEEDAFLANEAADLAFVAGLKQIRTDIEAEQTGLKHKSLEDAEKWINDRLNETTLDAETKVGLGKIFKKLSSFVL